VDVMKDYLANFDPRIEGLVPTADQLPGLASDFRIYHAKSPTSDGSYTMDHTASIFLFDADGQFAGTLSYGEAPEMRAAKLRRLLHKLGCQALPSERASLSAGETGSCRLAESAEMPVSGKPI